MRRASLLFFLFLLRLGMAIAIELVFELFEHDDAA